MLCFFLTWFGHVLVKESFAFLISHLWPSDSGSIGIGNVCFREEGKTGVPEEKPLGAKTRTNNKLNPHMTPSPGIEPGPHWWEASALSASQPNFNAATENTRRKSI